jgi:hypothetical protein
MRILAVLLIGICLTGCGAVGHVAELQQQSYRISEALKKDFKYDIGVQISIWNGSSVSATVTLDANYVTTATVESLERRVLEVVTNVLQRRPAELNIVLRKAL